MSGVTPVPHRHKVREIAQQSGLSEATVDRVLHERPGVRAATVAEVERAVEELDRQASQLRLVGRTFLLDLVMQAPERFSAAVRSALEAELPALRPAAVRIRFHLAEEADPAAMAGMLRKVRAKGSHGVLLKAPDHPAVEAEVAALHEAGIPVVTLVTDLPGSERRAYVGIDNRAAGATAAYLVARSAASGDVLVTLSRSDFRGEEQRVEGFVEALRTLAPGRDVVDLTDTDGLDATTLRAVQEALVAHPDVDAVYSVGGGNRATLDAFARAGRTLGVFVAHDLDDDNTELLRTRRISYVLHHDLRADARRACRLVMQAHRALPGVPSTVPAQVQVVTPYNQPSAFAPT
ncbi:LacI family DNA-binding transcriptional regulator [Aeromicrobium sp. Root495]|uniref:LacI family DNA-binding transcriptional regulator n=1 Tax=Aeromicrobium sp. Root495 TaxID=1736550 RepID=UPI001F2DEBE5|nr:LacI family DNA-binding transcriptional regulator [Aeromicrobium sp. Root495]